MEEKMLIAYVDCRACGIYVNGIFEGSLPPGCDDIENLQNFVHDDFKFKNIKTVWVETPENGWPKNAKDLKEA